MEVIAASSSKYRRDEGFPRIRTGKPVFPLYHKKTTLFPLYISIGNPRPKELFLDVFWICSLFSKTSYRSDRTLAENFVPANFRAAIYGVPATTVYSLEHVAACGWLAVVAPASHSGLSCSSGTRQVRACILRWYSSLPDRLLCTVVSAEFCVALLVICPGSFMPEEGRCRTARTRKRKAASGRCASGSQFLTFSCPLAAFALCGTVEVWSKFAPQAIAEPVSVYN